jgi:NAD(P)-dependent dehydrogenase (short-subunit alcohol dehydrogenase family)
MSSSTKAQRVTLVTGGTQGIGRAVCLELARRGDRVLFVGRNPELAAAVLAELHAIHAGAEHAFIQADLSLLSETARAAAEVARHTERLDAAVLCAGILSTIPEWTQEGLERNFTLNYLSRFLLVERLLPALCESASGRVVLVANAGKYGDTLDFADLQHRLGKAGLHVAGRTQFANDLFALELAERVQGTRVEVSCVFPGVVRTAVFRNALGLPWFLRLAAPLLQWFALSPEAAAETPSFLAHDEQARGKNGRFFGPHRRELPVPPRVRQADRRAQLWRASEVLISAIVPLRPESPPRAGARLEERHSRPLAAVEP